MQAAKKYPFDKKLRFKGWKGFFGDNGRGLVSCCKGKKPELQTHQNPQLLIEKLTDL